MSERNVPDACGREVVFDVERRDGPILLQVSAERYLLARLASRERSRVRARVRRCIDTLRVRVISSESQTTTDATTHVDVTRVANRTSGRIEIRVESLETEIIRKHASARDADYRSLQVRASER